MHNNSHNSTISRELHEPVPPLERAIGAVLLANYLLVVIQKIAKGLPEEILWASHVGLFIAGLGLFFNRFILVTTAATLIFTFHATWIIDAVTWLLTGRFPIGITSYLARADLHIWLATFHHFYLLPTLIILILRRREWSKISWILATILFAMLTLLARGFGHPEPNVNSAFRIVEGMDDTFFAATNRLPAALYLLTLDAAAAVNFFLVSSVLRFICAKRFPLSRQLADNSARG